MLTGRKCGRKVRALRVICLSRLNKKLDRRYVVNQIESRIACYLKTTDEMKDECVVSIYHVFRRAE
jgi:hypothetical protein